jgi:FkbM family methyltransferase
MVTDDILITVFDSRNSTLTGGWSVKFLRKKYLDTNWWRSALVSRWSNAIESYRFSPYKAKLIVNDIPFVFAVTTPLAKNWYALDENLHSHEMDALFALGLKGATVFECGGHHGRDCVLLAKMVGDEGHVVSFEPHPHNIDVLRRNIGLNQLHNTIPVHAAVGSRNGSLSIRARSNAKVTNRGGIEVPVVTIDNWAEDHRMWPDVIKIDVEGYEFEVLRGAKKALKRSPALAVEIHCNIVEEFGSKPEDIWDLVDLSQYDVFIQRHDGVAVEPLSEMERLEGRPHLLFVPHRQRVEP